MKWEDKGILISIIKFQETDVIGTFITENHGLVKGLIKGGTSKKQKPYLQIGNEFNITWKSRLEEHLGFFILEAIKIYGTILFNNELKLKLLSCICNILYDSMAENHIATEIYKNTKLFINNLELNFNNLQLLYSYINWEKETLRNLGFAFNLTKCNATGSTSDLIYISPNSGHAISKFAGEKYKAKLLPFPIIWKNNKYTEFKNITQKNINEALTVLEFFYSKRIYFEKKKDIPFIRKTIYIK